MIVEQEVVEQLEEAHISGTNETRRTERSATTINRVSTVDALTEVLRQRILAGDEPPGAALREIELCRDFGVSRHSFRSATQILVHEGLLRHEPHRGIFVPEIDADDIRDVYRLRLALETEAVRIICIERKSLDSIKIAMDRLTELGPESPWRLHVDADLRFHRALVECVQSARFNRAFSPLESETRLCLARFEERVGDRVDLLAQHGKVFRALHRRSVDQSATYLRAHLDKSTDEVVAFAKERQHAERR